MNMEIIIMGILILFVLCEIFLIDRDLKNIEKQVEEFKREINKKND